jgi:hypothetical protein
MPQQNIKNPSKGYYGRPTTAYENMSPYFGITIVLILVLIVARIRYIAKRDKYRNTELPTKPYQKKKA